MKLTLGFSPCPNDTFIFDALIHHKIDTEGLEFVVSFEDVEALNKMASENVLDITKLSYHAFAHLTENYQLLDAGSALGFGVGPLLITHNENLAAQLRAGTFENWDTLRVGIPGPMTTANFLLGLCFPQIEASQKQAILFSDIEQSLLDDQIDLGLIIHENRFTYEDKGLLLIQDLGEFWENLTNQPIPLGGIVVKKELPTEIKQRINRVLKRSIEFAFAEPQSSLPFIRQHAQVMDDDIMYQHIDLYVNNFSIDLGRVGKDAISFMFNKAQELQLIPAYDVNQIFLNPLKAAEPAEEDSTR